MSSLPMNMEVGESHLRADSLVALWVVVPPTWVLWDQWVEVQWDHQVDHQEVLQDHHHLGDVVQWDHLMVLLLLCGVHQMENLKGCLGKANHS